MKIEKHMSVQSSTRKAAALSLGLLLLAGCVSQPPMGPLVAIMPGPKKTFAQFQQDDLTCRDFAQRSTGGQTSVDAANQSAAGNAALGTLLGAGAGALLGAAAGNAGAGAAVGAGAGLLGGSAVASRNAAASTANLQQRYDIAYAQCMSAQGNPPPQGYY